VIPVQLRIAIVVAMDEPELVGNGCKLDVQRTKWFQVAKQDNCGRPQLTGSPKDVLEPAVRVAAK